MSSTSSGEPSRISTPSRPSPRGRSPIARSSSGVSPDVMNVTIRPVSSATPSAAYRTGTTRRESSTIRCSSTSRSISDATASAAS